MHLTQSSRLQSFFKHHRRGNSLCYYIGSRGDESTQPAFVRHRSASLNSGVGPPKIAMRLLISFVFICSMWNPHDAIGIPTCELKNKEVETFIHTIATKLGGEEYCEYRHYAESQDVDHDGRDDFLMIFTIEGSGGGNNTIQFLGIWTSSMKLGAEPLYTKVGERGERVIDSIDVVNKRIVLNAREYKKGDPMCCPSGAREISFVISAGKIVLVN